MPSSFKKLFLSILCATLVGACDNRESSKDKLVLGTSSDNPPYEFFSSEENKVTGFDVELAELIAKELNKDLEVKDMDFNTLIPAVSAGRIDVAMASITPSNERKKSVAFSDIYHRTKAAMIVKKDGGIKSTKDFKRKKIGVQMGTTHESFLKEVYENTRDFEIIPRNKTNELMQELKNGRIDVAIMGTRPASEYAKSDDELEAIVIESSIVSYAIALKKDSPAVKEINKAIEHLRKKR